MEKQITLRFPAKCKQCADTIPAGARAIWLGQKQGVRHTTCTKQSEAPKPKTEPEGTDVWTVDFSELRNLWHTFTEDAGRVYTTVKANAEHGRRLAGDWTEKWSGSSIPEMREFIQRGYRVEGLQGVTSLIPARPRRKLRYAEEGDELLLELAWAGNDTPFMEWEKRVSKPGLSVEIYMTFNSTFPAPVIAQYQRWIARALQTLDENGVDMEVNLTMPGTGVYKGEYGITKTNIRVRKPGEASDFANWSSMFSPGGFRQLGIMAIGLHADRKGKEIGYGYGSSKDYGKWEVAYDADRNVIVIGNNGSEREFPELQMTESLRSVLEKVNG